MPYTDIYLYSPLSTQSVQEGEGCALLLQFILSEIFLCADSDKKEDPLEFVFSSPACFFPYDWSYEVGCLNKIDEHSQLLSAAFPDMAEEVDDFQTILEAILLEVVDRKKHRVKISREELMGALGELYEKAVPFLSACKESENLVLFLLKHAEEIGELSPSAGVASLMSQLFPDRSFAEIRSRYDLRGFGSQRAEFDALIATYER